MAQARPRRTSVLGVAAQVGFAVGLSAVLSFAAPNESEGRARQRAVEIAQAASDAVAAAFDRMDPERDVAGVLAVKLGGGDTDLAGVFDRREVELRWDGLNWSFRDKTVGGEWQPGGSMPLGQAINAAGPWGRVVIPSGAPAVQGAALGRASWNSATATHRGPVLVRGGTVRDVTSLGEGAPALWFDGCEILASTGSKAAVQIHKGVALGTPLAFTDCEFGAVDPAHRGWGDHPMMWAVRAYAQGPLGFAGCRFRAHTSEHSIYASNVQGALSIVDCDFEPSPRTNLQVTNRVREGPPGEGPIGIRNNRLQISRKVRDGAGGGGSITIAGHHGPVALLDIEFITGTTHYPWDSHNALIVVWGEPTPGPNGGAHLLPDGYWIPELAVAGLQLGRAPEDGPYTPDREPVMVSAVREVWMEAPASAQVAVVGWGSTGGHAGRLMVNASGPNTVAGQSVEIGVLRWERAPADAAGEPWWSVVGAGWAVGLPAHPAAGDYGPAAMKAD